MCETNIILTSTPDKDDNQKSKLYTNFIFEYQCKNSTYQNDPEEKKVTQKHIKYKTYICCFFQEYKYVSILGNLLL